MPFELRFGTQDVRILENQASWSGHYAVRTLTLQHRTFAGGWSEPLVREVFERGNAVGVLPYDPETDSLVLIEQFRPGALRANDNPWMLELIAGVVEDGEQDHEVVHREAMEEAGCELSELLPVATVLPSAGACSERVGLFCGRVKSADIGAIRGLDNEGEDILVHCLPREEVLQLLARDRLPNGHTVIALQWLQLNLESVRERWR
tara:strand:- start:9158 stop:9775 length:618 start_codon:yes stop_codon:yes gene_type:complete